MRLKPIIIAVVLWNLGMQAATADVSVVGSLTHDKTVSIGKSYEGSIVLSNREDAPQAARVYQTDYLFYSDGRNLYGEPGRDPRSNAQWITFVPHNMEIPAKSSAEVHYTITVPDDMGLSGTYWSLIMVEGVDIEKTDAPQEKNKVSIRQVIRYAIQIVTNVGVTGEKKLEFKKTKLLKLTDKRILEEDIENTGQRGLIPMLWVELYDQASALKGRFEGGTSRVYPQTSARFRADLSSVKEGEYKALIIADCGGEDVYGISSKLKISDAQEAPQAKPVPQALPKQKPVPAPQPLLKPYAVPHAVSSLFIFLGILGAVLLGFNQRKRIVIGMSRAGEFIHTRAAQPLPAPAIVTSPIAPSDQIKMRMEQNNPAVDIFEAISILVDNAHILALGARPLPHASAGLDILALR